MAHPQRNQGPADLDAIFSQAITYHRAGQLADAEALYRRVLQDVPRHFDSVHLLGVICYQHGDYAEAVRQIDFALTINPAVSDAYNNRGNALKRLGRHGDALASYNKAIALKGDDAASYNNRGSVLKDLKRYDEARADLDKAIALKPDFAEAFSNRGNVLWKLGRGEEALADYDRAKALRPNHAEAFFNRGTTLKDLKRIDEAIAEFDQAVSIMPDYADALWNRAMCKLLVGRCREGWADYAWRWQTAHMMPHHRTFRQRQWSGRTDISGKTILLYAEQGFGDTIMAARYVPHVVARGARVILDVQPALVPLLAELRGVEAIVSNGQAPPAFEFHCPMMSLPAAFETTLDTIPSDVPYLSVPQVHTEKWSQLLPRSPRRRIGISWAGNPAFVYDAERSLGLTRMLPLLSRTDVQFVSIQKALREEDADILRAHPQIKLVGHAIDSFADTAALIASLDLVISSDTSVVHLAGALGKPVWILLQFVPDWRWLLDRTDCPWYPTARLFRQAERNNWETVISDVERALGQFMAG